MLRRKLQLLSIPLSDSPAMLWNHSMFSSSVSMLSKVSLRVLSATGQIAFLFVVLVIFGCHIAGTAFIGHRTAKPKGQVPEGIVKVR